MRILFLAFFFSINLSAYAQTCDDPDNPKPTRAYFVNGMNNDQTNRRLGLAAITSLLGSDYEVRLSTNNNDKGLDLLLELYRQKVNEPSQFWEWVANINISPNWFKTYFYEYMADYADIEYDTDLDLRVMVAQYIRDLRSGKKVILVAHSQGSFYANTAYQYIAVKYPQYKDSISIVAIATPAARILGNGRWHTNSLDIVVKGVREITSVGVLPANFSQFTPADISHHSLRASYLPVRGALIKQDVAQLESLLVTPVKDPVCDPTAEIETGSVSSITDSSAVIEGILTNGSEVDVWFVWGTTGSVVSCSGLDEDGSGQHSSPARVLVSATNLNPSTRYYYRACAKGRDGKLSYGDLKTFVTTEDSTPPPPEISCSSQAYKGGTNGLRVIVDFGTQKGTATVGFEAFDVPDRMMIYKHNTSNLLLNTPGFVSGYNYGSFNVDSSFSKVDVVVIGNTITTTLWELTINCP